MICWCKDSYTSTKVIWHKQKQCACQRTCCRPRVQPMLAWPPLPQWGSLQLDHIRENRPHIEINLIEDFRVDQKTPLTCDTLGRRSTFWMGGGGGGGKTSKRKGVRPRRGSKATEWGDAWCGRGYPLNFLGWYSEHRFISVLSSVLTSVLSTRVTTPLKRL